MPRFPQAQAQQRDLYADLGVSSEATEFEIRKAYKELVLKVHPDKQGDAAEFRKVQGAYDVLRDPAKRGQYDTKQTTTDDAWGDYDSDDSDYDSYGYSHHTYSAFEEFIRQQQARARAHDFASRWQSWYEEEERDYARYRRRQQQAQETYRESMRQQAAEQKQADVEREEEAREDAIAREDRIHDKLSKAGKKAKQAPSRKNCTCQGCRDRFVRETNEKDLKKKNPTSYAERMAFREQIAARKQREAAENARRDAERQAEEQQAAEEAVVAKKAQEKATAEQTAREHLYQQIAEQEARRREKEQAAADEIAHRRKLQQLAERKAKEDAQRKAKEAKEAAEQKRKEIAERNAKEAAAREAEEAAHRLAEQEAKKAFAREAAVREKARRKAQEAAERLAQQQAEEEAKIAAAKQKEEELAAHRREAQRIKEDAKRLAREVSKREAAERVARKKATQLTQEAAERLAQQQANEEAKAAAAKQKKEEQSARRREANRVKQAAKRANKAAARREAQEAVNREIKLAVEPMIEESSEQEATTNPAPERRMPATVRCKFGTRCKYLADGTCAFLHEQVIPAVPCKFGNNCKHLAKGNCTFLHDQASFPTILCKFGNRCKYLASGTCTYLHEQGPDTATRSVDPKDNEAQPPAVQQPKPTKASSKRTNKNETVDGAAQKSGNQSDNIFKQLLPTKLQAQKASVKTTKESVNGETKKLDNRNEGQNKEHINVGPAHSNTSPQKSKRELAEDYIETAKANLFQDLLAQGKRVPDEGIQVKLGWVSVGPQNFCSFCKLAPLQYGFRCPQGGAVACGRCKKSLSLVIPEDEAMA